MNRYTRWMMAPTHRSPAAFRLLAAGGAAFLFLVGAASSQAQALRTQTLQLVTGWNAVYLEVDPTEPGPAELFAGLPIDVVAAYAPSKRGAQFVKDPDANLLRAYGWSVWYAPHRSDAFLGSLHAIYGAKSYLIHAATNATLQVEGTVPLARTSWIPKAYNFVGFTVQSPGGPTFREFFQASPAHNHNKIYRLVNGTWRQVLDPSAAAMRSGEAFWIYCKGHSSYPGPLGVSSPSEMGLVLSSQGGSELVLRNNTAYPLAVTLDHIVEGNDAIPLSVPVRTFDPEAKVLRTMQVAMDEGAWSQTLPPLEAGKALRLPLELRLQDVAPGLRHSLIAVRSDIGTVTYVPITASRDE